MDDELEVLYEVLMEYANDIDQRAERLIGAVESESPQALHARQAMEMVSMARREISKLVES